MGRSIQAIVGGTASGASQDAVVVLARFDAGLRRSLCTATLVAPNLVLTARHCVTESDSVAGCAPDGTAAMGGGLHADFVPHELAVFAAKNGVVASTTNESKASAHGASLVVDSSATICNHDLAFVVLDRAIDDAAIAPIRLGPPTAGESLTAVGFGVVDTGALPASRQQRTGVALLGQGPLAFADDPRFGAGEAEVVVGASACSGDSGGPLFVPSGAVAGVASRAGNGKPKDPENVASTCVGDTAHAVYGQLGPAAALVTRAFIEAKATPWLEGSPKPTPPKDPSACGGAPCPAHDPTRPISMPVVSATADPDAPPPVAEQASTGCTVSLLGRADDLGALAEPVGLAALVGMVLRLRRRRAA